MPGVLRWPLTMARGFFGVLGAIGAIAFILHAITFYTAWHYAAATPAGDKVYRIADHGHSVYVTHPAHAIIAGLGITFLIGLGVGVAGGLATEAIIRFVLPRKSSGERVR